MQTKNSSILHTANRKEKANRTFGQGQPFVSIVSVNYNNTEDTRAFLKSCNHLDYSNFEIIIVDNGSKVPISISKEDGFFCEVRIIESPKNLGFAGGNNLGIREAKGEFIFLLNNDTEVPEGLLLECIDFFIKTPDAGAASPKVLYPDRKTIQYAGAKGINNFTGRGKRLGLFEEDKGQYDYVRPTDLGHGAAYIFRREIIETVGLMPEQYFLYYEEHDWTEQIKSSGYKFYYIGTTYVIHKESVTVGEDSPLKVYYLTRNRILFLRRNCSTMQLFFGIIFFLVFSSSKQTILYLISGKFDLLKAFWKGFFWNLSH